MSRFLFWSLSVTAIVCPLYATVSGTLSPRLPLVFEPNEGRWNRNVKFSASAGGYRVFLTPQGADIAASGAGESGKALSIRLLNANPSPELTGADALRCRTSYFIGKQKADWLTGVPNYARVQYRGVYPGIDMVYYGAGRDLEYDFVLAPNADPNRIRLKFKGMGHLNVTPEGNLAVDLGGARLIERKPIVYQDSPEGRREISGRFKLLGRDVVGFELASYDRSRRLIIDPSLSYSTLLGSSGNDSVVGVKVGKNGLVYVAGYMSSGDFGVAAASYAPDAGGTSALFIAVLDPTKSGGDSLVYFTYLGGTGADVANSMTLDSNGVVYLTGSTTSNDFPIVNGAQPNYVAGTDAFAVKFDPSRQGAAALVYSTYIGGSDIEIGYGIDVDAKGVMYITGMTRSNDFPATSSAYANIRYGNQDAFLTAVDPSSNAYFIYSSFIGGENEDVGRAIAVTASGIAYIAGDTVGTQFPQANANAYQPTGYGGASIFIAQMDVRQFGVNSLVYSTYFGGTQLNAARKISLDSNGKLLLTGYTLSPDFPITPGALQTTLNGPANTFITRFDPAAPASTAVLYSTYFGGSSGEVPYDMATDADGNVYVTGYTLSTDFPVTPDAMQPKNGGGFNVFISKLDITAGTSSLVYSTYAGQDGINVGYGIAVSPAGVIYAGGQSAADNVTTTASAAQHDFAGGQSDGFVLVLK